MDLSNGIFVAVFVSALSKNDMLEVNESASRQSFVVFSSQQSFVVFSSLNV